MTCPDCTAAEQMGQTWGGYRAGCDGCRARAVSRSGAMFQAVRRNRANELIEMTQRLWPATPFERIKTDLMRWWRIDHPEQKGQQ
jgi:hypothetical protein